MHLVIFAVVFWVINKIREYLFDQKPRIKNLFEKSAFDKFMLLSFIIWMCWKLAKIIIHYFKL